MSIDNSRELLRQIRRIGETQQIELSGEQAEAMARYVALVLSFNRRIRITGSRTKEEFLDKHLADSLALAGMIVAANKKKREKGPESLIDVGTGAGLPGIPLAIAVPWIEVTLCDRSEKKTALLFELQRRLGFRARIVCRQIGRAENREKYDHAVARATLPPGEWLAMATGLVRPGGAIWLMLSQRQAASFKHGGQCAQYELPDGTRRVIVFLTRRVDVEL